MKKDSKLLKIGVLGCGQISQAAHFEACNRAHNTELYAICDVAEDLLEKMVCMHNARVTYNNYENMLDDPEIDAVIIGIADQFHIPCAKQAIAAGKHVLVEKPLGVTVQECEELREMAEKAGLIVQVGNMKRFDQGVCFARDFIQKEIGELLVIKAWYCDSTYRYTVTDNVQPIILQSANAKRPGGNPKAEKEKYYMLTHGSHLVDTARFLGGEIKSVHAQLVKKYDAYSWQIAAEFINGSIGNLDLTVAVRMDWHEGFEVYGENGSVTAKTYNPWLFKSSDVEVFSIKDGLYKRPIAEDGHFYKRQVEGFADAILNGAPLRGASIDDGIAAMRTITAIHRSVATGERINIADI